MSEYGEYYEVCIRSVSNVRDLITRILNISGFYCNMNVRVYCKDRYIYVDVYPNPFRYCDPYCDEGCATSRFHTLHHELMRVSRRLLDDPRFAVNPALICLGVVKDGDIDYRPVTVIHSARDLVSDLMKQGVLMLRFELFRLGVPVPKIGVSDALSRFWGAQ